MTDNSHSSGPALPFSALLLMIVTCALMILSAGAKILGAPIHDFIVLGAIVAAMAACIWAALATYLPARS